jgi:hypothetical protein
MRSDFSRLRRGDCAAWDDHQGDETPIGGEEVIVRALNAHPESLARVAKDRSLVKYSVLNESRQLFASKYRPYLPSEEELRAELDRERSRAVCELPISSLPDLLK